MAKTIHDIETKVNDDGATPQGRLTASDFNTVVRTVQELDKKNVLISQEDFDALEQAGQVDPTKVYMIYEE